MHKFVKDDHIVILSHAPYFQQQPGTVKGYSHTGIFVLVAVDEFEYGSEEYPAAYHYFYESDLEKLDAPESD